jgi:hypothetical protein
MSAMAKKGREALKAKARKMATGSDQKVDASSWTPPGPMKADVKTGMRPISRRAYKTGGKVTGEDEAPRMDRKPRATGGCAPKAMADAKVNRNVKDANEEREGKKHVGALKTGGRAKRANGGDVDDASKATSKSQNVSRPEYNEDAVNKAIAGSRQKIGSGEAKAIHGLLKGRTKRESGGAATTSDTKKSVDESLGKTTGSYFKAKPNAPVGAPGTKPVGLDKDQVERMERGYKKGGATKKAIGGASILGGLGAGLAAGEFGGKDKDDKAMKKGGRAERKSGGRVGKTNINIVIATKPQGGPDGTVTVPDAMRPPGGIPVPVPPPGGAGGPPPGGMPMPMGPPPGAAPMGPPPGMPPMARKRGGRVFSSYKDMKASASSGEGRLEKTEIQKKKG